MRKIIKGIFAFSLGFCTISYFIDTPEMIAKKGILLVIAGTLQFIVNLNDTIKK